MCQRCPAGCGSAPGPSPAAPARLPAPHPRTPTPPPRRCGRLRRGRAGGWQHTRAAGGRPPPKRGLPAEVFYRGHAARCCRAREKGRTPHGPPGAPGSGLMRRQDVEVSQQGRQQPDATVELGDTGRQRQPPVTTQS